MKLDLKDRVAIVTGASKGIGLEVTRVLLEEGARVVAASRRPGDAGGPPPGATLPRFGFLGLSDEDWRAMLEFNLLSAVRMCRSTIPLMLERGGGAIVNVSSVHGRQPSSINVDYGAAKAAMINLTKALSDEFGPEGVRVNGVCPGPVRTPWWTEEGGAADLLVDSGMVKTT